MFSNKTIIITGAANGIGSCIAKIYAQHHANIILADIDEENGIKCCKDIISSGGKAFFIKTNVLNEADIINLTQNTLRIFGQIDIVINNECRNI